MNDVTIQILLKNHASDEWEGFKKKETKYEQANTTHTSNKNNIRKKGKLEAKKSWINWMRPY